jgi:uncharacterized protein YcfL
MRLSYFLILILIGCSGPYLNNVPNQSISLPPQVIINNPQLQREVSIGVGSDRTNDNDVLEAFVDISNNTETKQTLYYRFRWFDIEDYEVGENLSIWKPLFLEAKDSQKIKGIAPTPKANSFKLYIKKGLE